MFDGSDLANDIDLRLQNLPLTIGSHSITNRPPSGGGGASTPSPRPTTLSRGRSITSDIKKESTPATLKDIDMLKLSHRHLETRLHELESRVQYVNPWAVQHMWETLMKLQERTIGGGGDHSHPSFPAVIFASPHQQKASASSHPRSSYQKSTRSDGAADDLLTDPMSPREADAYRSCSPLTPNAPMSTTFDVSMLMPHEGPQAHSATDATLVYSMLATRMQGMTLEEWMHRQQWVIEESLQRNRLMVAMTASYAAASSSNGATTSADVWATPTTKPARGGGRAAPQSPTFQRSGASASGSLFRVSDADDRDEDMLVSSSSAGRSLRLGSNSQPGTPPPPRLRSKFVEALITDSGFEERIRSMLADFVHPIVESSQKRFVTDAERWMQVHTGNIHHEFHEQMKTLTSEKDAATALIHGRIDAATTAIHDVVANAKSVVHDAVTTVDRLREDVVESSSAVALKIQRLDAFQQEMTKQVNMALDARLSSLRSSLERIGEHQDLLHRRLDDVQTRHIVGDGSGGADVDYIGGHGESLQRKQVTSDGAALEQSVAYLDGMLLAPSAVTPADGEGDHEEPASQYNNRLSDSVLLHDLHNALHRMWGVVTTRGGGATTSSQPQLSHTTLAVGIKDLVCRPVSLFPMQLITAVVSTFLLRHNIFSLRSECARMKLPAHVGSGLEIGWKWLASLSIGVLLRRGLTLFPEDQDPLKVHSELDEDYANDFVLQAYGVPHGTASTASQWRDHRRHSVARSTSATAPSRSVSRSRSPAATPQQPHEHLPAHHNKPQQQQKQHHSDTVRTHNVHPNTQLHEQHYQKRPSLEMLASGAAESLIQDSFDAEYNTHHQQRRPPAAHEQHGTSFYTSLGPTTRDNINVDPRLGMGFYGSSRGHSGQPMGLVSSAARGFDAASGQSSSRGSSRAPSPSVRKKLAFR